MSSSIVVRESWFVRRFYDSRFAIRDSRGLVGFSLIEIVMAMAILSVGVVGAMRVFPVGLRASVRAEHSSRSAMVAGRTLEALKLKSWDELVIGETSEEIEGLTLTTRILHPAETHLADTTRLKLIEVRVRWEQEGRPRESTFVTYVRRDIR